MLQETRISPGDFAAIQHLIPDAEPQLEAPECGAGILPVSAPSLDGNELRYVTDCIETNWISSAGPYVKKFETAFAAACGCEFGIACSSGTAAYHLILAALGIGSGNEVIVPAFTMIATANGVSYTGATPVLVDAEPVTWNLDVAALEAKITSRTKAIAVVHTYGHPAEMNRVLEIARRHRVPVIEDAAEAHGAKYHGRPVGSIGDAAAFSFYGNKILTTGEGGMVTTNDAALAAVVRRLRDHAFCDDRHFWHTFRGFNYRMTNLQAAVGLAQTERLEEFVAKRRRNAELYTAQLRNIHGLSLPVEREGMQSVFWMYCILVEDEFGCSRDELRRRLARRGIETRTMFVPLHLQPIYFEQFRGQRYPVAEALCRKGMYLPSSSALTTADIDRVVAEIRRARDQRNPSSS
jgi:perosamine synthetase